MRQPIQPENWIRPQILKLSAYAIEEAEHCIRLDTMENPYQWNEALQKQWLEILQTTALNRYPDPKAKKLEQQLRQTLSIPDEASVLLGNGSDEVIQMLLMTFNQPDAAILVPEPSFPMYYQVASVLGMKYYSIPLEEETFDLDMFALLEVIHNYNPALIFLAYPNNPTGNSFSVTDIEDILDTSNGLVVIDEAYFPFSEGSFLSRLKDYPNLLVMSTLSKLGLAALRLGFVAGHPDWITEINKARLPYNINTLTQLSATFALQHYSVFMQQVEQIKKDREDLLKELQTFPQIKTWVSDTNFILFRVPKARLIFQRLKQEGILVKCLDGAYPSLSNCLRVVVGTAQENQAFLKGLRKALQ